jgi:hypothetical protein
VSAVVILVEAKLAFLFRGVRLVCLERHLV